MIGALIIALALVGLIGIWIVIKSEKKSICEHFAGRSPISIDEFINMLDLDGVGQECINNALKELSVVFSVKKELIRPTDRFDIEFAPIKGSEMDSPIGTLEFALASEAKAKGIDVKNLNIETVRDFIAFKCGKAS